MLLIIIILITSIALIVLGKWASKRNFLNGRKLISLKDLYEQYDLENNNVTYDTFEKVLKIIGDAYRIDSRMLRVSDSLESLYDIDSWDVDEGTNSLNESILNEFSINDFEITPKTIGQLVIEIERNKAKV